MQPSTHPPCADLVGPAFIQVSDPGPSPCAEHRIESRSKRPRRHDGWHAMAGSVWRHDSRVAHAEGRWGIRGGEEETRRAVRRHDCRRATAEAAALFLDRGRKEWPDLWRPVEGQRRARDERDAFFL